MARQLTKKQREFVKAYAEQGNGVKAAHFSSWRSKQAASPLVVTPAYLILCRL